MKISLSLITCSCIVLFFCVLLSVSCMTYFWWRSCMAYFDDCLHDLFLVKVCDGLLLWSITQKSRLLFIHGISTFLVLRKRWHVENGQFCLVQVVSLYFKFNHNNLLWIMTFFKIYLNEDLCLIIYLANVSYYGPNIYPEFCLSAVKGDNLKTTEKLSIDYLCMAFPG